MFQTFGHGPQGGGEPAREGAWSTSRPLAEQAGGAGQCSSGQLRPSVEQQSGAGQQSSTEQPSGATVQSSTGESPAGEQAFLPGGVGLADGARLVESLREVREALGQVVDVLPRVAGADLAALAAAAAGVVAAAKAAQAAIVWEADERGVIAASDHPRVSGWVEQSCREGDTPLTPGVGRALEQLTRACRGHHDLTPLRAAVQGGQMPVERGAEVASTYRRLKARIEVNCWDVVLAELMGFVASGARRADVAALEETLVGQYGREGELDDERARLYERRELTTFRKTRAGMLEARMLLDPASEAILSAALHALSAPCPDPDTGQGDPRTPGMRRADALMAMARHATTADPAVPGIGPGARVVVTMTLADLQADLLDDLATTGQTNHPQSTEHSAHDAWHGQTMGAHDAQGQEGQQDARGRQDEPNERGSPNGQGEPGQQGGLGARHGEHGTDDAPEPATVRPRRVGMTAFGQVLTPGEVRQLACDAQITPAVLGGAGELLELGRTRRLATPGILTALALRDKGCSYPGCTMPPGWTDAHHLRHWVDGGPTEPDNMTLLCRHHHTTVHRHQHIGDVINGEVVWRRRDGSPIGNHPRAA